MRGDNVEEFAAFAHHVHLCRKNTGRIEQRLRNIKSLFEASTSICCLMYGFEISMYIKYLCICLLIRSM